MFPTLVSGSARLQSPPAKGGWHTLTPSYPLRRYRDALQPNRNPVPTIATPPKALILVAAELEADILFGPIGHRASFLEVLVAGVGPRGDMAALGAIDSTTADVVVNPGFAGGLSSAATPGRCFTVIDWFGLERPNLRCATPSSLLDELAPTASQPATAVTVDFPVGDPDERRRLACTGADLVEMEGARWATAAWRRGLPFVSLRVISDRADNALPRPRHELLTSTGSVHWARWLRAVAASDHGWQESFARLRAARQDWRLACESLGTVGTTLTAWQRNAAQL